MRCEPKAKVVTLWPRWICFLLLLTAPRAISSTMESVNISVWMPRSCLAHSAAPTASGIAPMPSWIQEPSSMRSAIRPPIVSLTASIFVGGSTGSSWLTSMRPATWLMWICAPQTARGCRSLTSRKTRLAFSIMAGL